jgi:hypothetical protein
MAFLNFSEHAVENEASFNGDLQWLLQPPFFREDLNHRLFFSYSTWDFPPRNRFRDRTSAELISGLEKGKPVNVYNWNAARRKLEYLGTKGWSLERATDSLSLEVMLKPSSDLPSGRTVWRSEKLTVDPMVYRHLAVKLILAKKDLFPNESFVLKWSSNQSDQTQEVRLEWPSKRKSAKAEATVWLYPGRHVDWLLAGVISELIVEVPQGAEVVSAQLSSAMSVESKRPSEHIDHYRNSELKFEWLGESWWDWEH